eukprot:CAMPEP_0167793706 /NCGR_PEP_ID=MMETSP0111_2-20121227/13347_1 /TAXON_ID=91324 /ORGANISM="Lotharella globosa, Strain CCCM811" /LENGTH=1364 /DNA_ID=CAMNT_0007686929 /DNA_START=58 /DNA_END=4149 /DNA_ORIENTATION=+
MNQAQPHQIFVHVIEGRGISAIDRKGLSDVQCNVTIGPKLRLKKTTYTKFQTANALFNEKFIFENVMLTKTEWETEKIALSVVDRNDFTPNASIGQVEFSLTNVYRQKNHEYYRKWTPIVRPHEPGKDHGWIQVSVYVLKKGDPTPSHEQTEYEHINDKEPVLRAPSDLKQSMFVLNVLLYRAEGLLPTHGKALNPFVSVRFNGATQQTKRMANIRNPIWNRKIVMPFQLPLHSDSIEIQVWNDNTLTPDTLIGQRTFSFQEERLQNRPFGPAWINLYSSHYIPPKTSFLGSIMDVLNRTQYIGQDEYVGRLLCRISVRRVEASLNPRLRVIPCPTAVEPKGLEYALDVYIYAGSEIPVQGGKVFVEVVFGSTRKWSRELIAELPGRYKWRAVFDQMTAFGPEKLDQVHDVILNVYHKAGYASRKIAFERIPVRSLVHDPKRITYRIDGRTWNGVNMPTPRWRALQNITYDEKRPHIIAGFLLCNIGFGLKHHRPTNLPTEIAEPESKGYVLRVYIHQGVNLPAANEDGSCNPFVLVRFAGRNEIIEIPATKKKGKKEPTNYPYYFTMVEIKADVDPAHVPSVNMMVYHKQTSGQKLLGRCEVLSDDILPPKDLEKAKFVRRMHTPVITRYPLQVAKVLDEDGAKRPGQEEVADDMEPSIVAQIQLVEYADCPPLIPGWRREGKDSAFARYENPFGMYEGKDAKIRPLMRPYMLKFSTVGLRGLKASGFERALSNPNLRIGLPPAFEDSETYEEWKIPKIRVTNNGTADVMETKIFEKIPVPRYSLSTTPVVVSLYDGNYLVARGYMPLSRFVGGKTWDIPRYKPGYDRTTGKARDYKTVAEAIEEVKNAELIKLRKEYAKKVAEGKDNDDEDDEEDTAEQLLLAADVPEKQIMIDITEDCNVVVDEFETKGEAPKDQTTQNEVKELDDNKAVVANELEMRKEYKKLADPFHHVFQLFRGRSVGITGGQLARRVLRGDQKHFGNPQDMIGNLKAYVVLAPWQEGDNLAKSKLESMQQLESYEQIHNVDYICRIYVFKAFNLSPRMHFNSHTCNPYLVIENGEDVDNQFSNEKNALENDLNPSFYQVVELQTRVPENDHLSIQIWDKDLTSNSLIGSTTVDIEDRLLHNKKTGDKEYRRLLNPDYSTSQGLILVRIDILTAEEARTTKPEELAPPQFWDYQLRLVLWSTQGIKFPQLENRAMDVDQKLIVTANFDGEGGQEVVKHTDVAWYAAEGNADWNWRMIFNLKLPCKNPRLTVSVWDENVLGSNEALGEVVLNLQSFFARCLLERTDKVRDKRKVVTFEHSSHRGTPIGSVKLEMAMYTKAAAEERPAGEAQNEPNVDPYLPNPKRNAPPWAVGTRALDW